ncbi:hypothetical protein J2850_004382 [Azospirillum picis]|uniref:Transposase n=1 Tax=Azospirillum picis TaxID=488438 RepID=A0ABU0MPX5_9PROT|nr:hypothetical protein [Azospirillum picis]MDQ0535520.1 hypothetical protein [Azospirillum picis]
MRYANDHADSMTVAALHNMNVPPPGFKEKRISQRFH